MAVNGITGSDSILSSALGSQAGTSVRRTPLPPGRTGPAPLAGAPAAAPADSATTAVSTTTPAAEAIVQNARLVNESLRNLIFPVDLAPTNNPLAETRLPLQSPLLTVLAETQALTPLQLNALQVNEALQNLNFVPPEPDNPLLINSLPAALEAAEILDDLDLIQDNARQVNEALLDLGFAPAGAALQPFPPAAAAARAAAETAAALTAAAAPRENLVLPAAGQAAGQASAAVPVPAAAIPVTARFLAPGLTPGLTPATLPLSLFPDRTPYVLAVYHLNDPAPPPRSPEPITKEVAPIPAVAAIRPIGESRLRQLLQRAKEGGLRRNVEYNTPLATLGQAEKSIRSTLVQVNADLAAHGLPLHVVFTKNENGFALDLYDCSYSGACRLSYDVPISFANLPTVLGNLQHETGIIVDTKL